MVIIADIIPDEFGTKQIGISAVALIALIGLGVIVAGTLSVETQNYDFAANGTAVDVQEGQNIAKLGVAPGESLTYGSVPVNSAVIRAINIDSDKKALVNTQVSGNISDHLEYKETHYFQGSRELQVNFNATEPGYYEGSVNMKISTSDNALGALWLDIRNSLF